MQVSFIKETVPVFKIVLEREYTDLQPLFYY